MSESEPPRLSIALAIYRLRPRGGLEDNCLRLAAALKARGHKVTIFTAVDGEAPGLERIILPRAASKWSNHKRMKAFAEDARKAIAAGGFDRSMAFQMMPGFDLVFLADNMRGDPKASLWQRMSGRYRTFAALERRVFAPGSPTRVIGLSNAQMAPFEAVYRSAPGQIRIAPPTLSREKYQPEARTAESRSRLRAICAISPQAPVFLALALMPQVKGLDRTIEALARISDAHILVAGVTTTDKRARAAAALADRLGVANRVHWLGYLNGGPLFEAMAASDLLAHPARTEVTGAVILEAIINGLPVVATSLCGFASHIVSANAGLTIDEPFSQSRYEAALGTVAGASASLSGNGILYGQRENLFNGLDMICGWIETGR